LAVSGVAGGPPIPMSVPVADLAGGMLAAVAVLSALVGRQSSGRGAYLDVAMIDAVTLWLAPVVGSIYAATGQNPQRGQLPLAGGLPCYNVYETADEKFLSLAALEGHFWTAFCNAINRSDWAPRQFDHSLGAELAGLFRQRPREEWIELLRETDVCLEPVNEMDEVLRHPQLIERGRAHSASSPAPALGQHTVEILKELGLSDSEIQDLDKAGIIKTA
jgi:crotonobetainyl-CoA:carnitine CoA-transferase CaiB-like acyl-CoA transferase